MGEAVKKICQRQKKAALMQQLSPVSPRQQHDDGQHECSGCKQPIRERYLLRALGSCWHEDCLKCSCCDCRLGEVGSTLFLKANLTLCRKDYLRLFGMAGHCSACSQSIPPLEMVMRAKDHFYHLDCFACQQCGHRFCVGDKYYLCGSRILCETDYEDMFGATANQKRNCSIGLSNAYMDVKGLNSSGNAVETSIM